MTTPPPTKGKQSPPSYPWYDWFTGTNELRVWSGASGAANKFFSSAGGAIASGLESGFVALFGDLWNVVAGPLYILIGGLIIMFTLMFAFRNQIIQLGGIAIPLAAAAA